MASSESEPRASTPAPRRVTSERFTRVATAPPDGSTSAINSRVELEPMSTTATRTGGSYQIESGSDERRPQPRGARHGRQQRDRARGGTAAGSEGVRGDRQRARRRQGARGGGRARRGGRRGGEPAGARRGERREHRGRRRAAASRRGQ